MAKSYYYEFRIYYNGRTMETTIIATNQSDARRLIQAQYPGCEIRHSQQGREV